MNAEITGVTKTLIEASVSGKPLFEQPPGSIQISTDSRTRFDQRFLVRIFTPYCRRHVAVYPLPAIIFLRASAPARHLPLRQRCSRIRPRVISSRAKAAHTP